MAMNKNLTRNERLKLISGVVLAILILTCFANYLLMYFVASSAKWKVVLGVVIVLVIDTSVFAKYDKRLYKGKKDITFSTIATSNFLAFTMSIGLSVFWLVFDKKVAVIVESAIAEMSSSSSGTKAIDLITKMIIDLIAISMNVPVINLGLAFLVILMLLFALLSKSGSGK